MPNVDFSEEQATVTATVRPAINEDKFPTSPRLAPLKAALAKLDLRSVASTATGAAARRVGRLRGSRWR